MAEINHTNVTLIEQRERAKKIVVVHKAHSNRYRSRSGRMAALLKILTVGSQGGLNNPIVPIVLKLTDSHCCLLNKLNI